MKLEGLFECQATEEQTKKRLETNITNQIFITAHLIS